MEDLFEHIQNEQILSVSEFLEYVSHVLSVVRGVKVTGEISSIAIHQTGTYISLKDQHSDSILKCYMNPYAYRGLGVPLAEGMEAVLSGYIQVYARRSELSFRVEDVQLSGEGALKKAYELLKQQLDDEGLFARKRELPEFIKTIGIVTSRSGAVLGDFRNNLIKRGFNVVLSDTRVEGAQAVSGIIKSIKRLVNTPKLDCLVIMRGGGSLEDLQAFNHESVVRALFSSSIPTIAAIGHDRDVPLVCLAADKFTSTPTSAAVLINQSWSRLENDVAQGEQSIIGGFEEALNHKRFALSELSRALIINSRQVISNHKRLSDTINRAMVSLGARINEAKIQEKQLSANITRAFAGALIYSKEVVANHQRLLDQSSPERQLKLGYSITRGQNGKIIRKVTDVKAGDSITVQVSDGDVRAKTV